MKITFDEIIALETGPTLYEYSERNHLRMHEYIVPLSIVEVEAQFMKNMIEKYNLKCGYEVATGFGLSALMAGSSFKETDGKLLSIDSFVEERHNDAGIYHNEKPSLNSNSIGHDSALYLRTKYNLDSVISFNTGWSPTDVPKLVNEFLNDGELFDYIFIDGGYFPEQIVLDIEAIFPYTDTKCVWFFHDVYDEIFTAEVKYYIFETFGKHITIVPPEHTEEQLGYIMIGFEN